MNQAKIMVAKKNMRPSIVNAGKPYIYRTSSGKTEAVVSKSGQVVRVRIVRGRDHAVSHANFEARTEKKVKRDKPNET
jgi:hypothetical protein